MALWLDTWLLINQRSVKFGSYRSRESNFITFFICHVTLYDYVMNRLSDLMYVKFDSHSSCRSWDIMFSICHVITWSHDQSIKRLNGWWPFTINLHLVNFSSHRLCGSGDISYFFSHVTYVATCSKCQVNQVWWPYVSSKWRYERRIHMIIYYKVWQFKFAGFFYIFRITKCRKVTLLQSVAKGARYYKVRQLLQSKT